MKNIFIIIFYTFFSLTSYSQSVKGRVTDAKTGSPLAFVNIIFDNTSRGVSSDIDGNFEIENISEIDSLHFIYVGYKKVNIATSSFPKGYIHIKMKASNYVLSEVSIFAKENPAHRIIKSCIENRKHNDPEKLKSFSYNAYHKMIFTSKSSAENQADSVEGYRAILKIGGANKEPQQKSANSNTDSLNEMHPNFFKSQHLFLMESVSNHFFKKPDKHYEKVIGTRISGLQDPMFVMLANQFQSFSFYKNSINLLDKQYVNPISPGSTKKYFFLIEDTILKNNDTVFVISFRPMKATNFDGLKGLLYINTNKYAVQNVIAEPADTSYSLGIKIQQKYDLIDSVWFPVQLNTNLEFSTIDINNEPLVGVGKSYLRDIEINKSLKSTKFSNVVLDIDSKAAKQDASFWEQNRAFAIDSLEMKTYKVIDSIGKKEHLDSKLGMLRALSNGNIPIGPIDLKLNKIINYNGFEGFRLGIGLQTNDKLSNWFILGGYGAFGLRDKKWKYGGELKFNLWRKQEMKLSCSYQNDVLESGKQYDFSTNSFISPSLYRNVLIKNMVYVNTYSSSIKFRAIPNFSWELGANYQQINSPTNYQYVIEDKPQSYVSKGDFNVFESHIGMRFAYKEKIIRNKLYQISMGTKYPILNINFTNATTGIINSELSYQKLDLQLDFSYNIKYIGRSSWRISAARAIGELPWYKLYNGKGSYASFFVESPYSFSTMRLNEFLSDEYLAVYYRHDFGSLLFGDKPFVPHPVLVSSFTIGNLQNADKHKNISFNTLEKGYYESGIMLNSILKSNLSQVGIGIMYRYGSYALTDIKDNFAYKLTVGFSL